MNIILEDKIPQYKEVTVREEGWWLPKGAIFFKKLWKCSWGKHGAQRNTCSEQKEQLCPQSLNPPGVPSLCGSHSWNTFLSLHLLWRLQTNVFSLALPTSYDLFTCKGSNKMTVKFKPDKHFSYRNRWLLWRLSYVSQSKPGIWKLFWSD